MPGFRFQGNPGSFLFSPFRSDAIEFESSFRNHESVPSATAPLSASEVLGKNLYKRRPVRVLPA